MSRIYDTRLGTIKKPKDEARLVITLDVRVDMSKTPNWQHDAIDVLRALDSDELLDRLRTGKSLRPVGVHVLSSKLEVAK